MKYLSGFSPAFQTTLRMLHSFVVDTKALSLYVCNLKKKLEH